MALLEVRGLSVIYGSGDSAVRAVSDAVQKPARAAAGFTDGVSHAFETFRAKRDRRGGVV